MEDNKTNNSAVNTKSDLAELIKNEIKNNLEIRVTADQRNSIEIKLLYEGELISNDYCQVISCLNYSR